MCRASRAVGLARSIAMGGVQGPLRSRLRTDLCPERHRHAASSRLEPGYFETMGNPVVAGRAITWTDIHQTAAVAVISENLAREYWGEPSKALGKRLGGSPTSGLKSWASWGTSGSMA